MSAFDCFFGLIIRENVYPCTGRRVFASSVVNFAIPPDVSTGARVATRIARKVVTPRPQASCLNER
ncbi:hypothetical protein Pla100_17230 [Neorhodopirellula pilleata]|uniref:Uncharacterized protein n=1 Tax=Neorhodopirellula pilleata TaxID=2714738 RepID=A0A5C6AR63_9BACT|nr:hypothetical protein Pla100_17230 [Neorhodopirellula pilleata]